MIQDIPKLYTALAEWLACVLFVRLLPQRYNAAKTAGILAAALPLFGLVQWLIGIVPLSLWIPGMVVALVLMYATIWLCCRLNFCDTGFWWALAFTLAEFVASLEWQLYSFGASKMPGSWWIQGLFLLVFYGGGFGVFLRLEQKRLRDKAPLHMTRRESISAAVIAICTFLISNISYVTTNTPFSGRMTTEIFWIRTLVDFAGVAVLLSMQDRWQDMQTQHELTAIQTLLKRQYEQYRISRDNSEAINRKYHDLKHQIQVIRMESDAARREEYLSQLEKGMQSLGVNQHTGNDVLDTILSDKQLYCSQHQITLTIVADGARLDFIETMDICSIFGNALDNAIEGVEKLADPQQRLIRVAVYRVCKEFKNVIVVVNSSNAMELGWLDQYDSIKAAVLCGAPGELGFDSLGKILSGEVNPSGHLADTYVYDLLATPTANNFGGFAYDNYAEVTGSQDNRAMFVNYCEGIYVGYKFYETAAAEGLIDYDKVVQYPFGYGLSYTTFDSSIAAVEDDGEKITLDVAVKNTGDTAGKYVAEIFYEPPYYNGGIEKAAANLVQYAKTEILQPGEAQTLKITFRYEDMASYDSNGIKSANGAYVLEAGDYKINLCSDSHTILDTYVAKVDKDVIYDDAHDGARSTDQVAATNQLTFAQGDVTYLSRADGFANYAEATAASANHSLSAQALADYASAATFDAAKYDDPNAVMPTTGANNGLKLADLAGVAYDDPKWEQLLDELTVNDLFSLTADGGYHTVGVESIGLSATEDCDGPTGVHSNYNPAAGPSYPGSVMLACTWNQPLAKARGEQIAKECAEINCAGWYAPAMNIHRSAFGGRNFEYYSECGVLSGLTAAAEVSGATENGLICYVKHFAFNDQDNYRQNNICTWLNEQAAREIYLKAFEQPIKAGGMGVMTSMNAVGPVWAGGCKALLTNILRDEWGFHGAVITDAVVSPWYMDGNLAIRTGGTKMLAFNITNEFYRDLNSVGTVTAMRNAAHGTLYALANSFAVTRAVSVPKWVKTTYAVDAVVAIILVAWEICAIRKYRKAKKEDEDTEQ